MMGMWTARALAVQLPPGSTTESTRRDQREDGHPSSCQFFKLGGPAPGVDHSAGDQRTDSNPPHDPNNENFSVIGPSNVDTVLVNGRPCQTLIDPGSQVTTVSASFVISHPTLSRITPEPSPVSINGAGGHTLPHNFIGVIPIEIKCQGRLYTNVSALIVPPNSYGPGVDALVGTNLVRVFQRDERRTRGDTYLPHLKKQNDAWYTACAAMDAALPGDRVGKIGVLTYQGKAPKVINPGEETDFFCRPPRQVARCTALIEPLGRTHHGTRMVVGRTLVDVNAGRHVPVRLLNTSDKPLTIFPRTKLVQMYIACAYENPTYPGDSAPVRMVHVSADTPPRPHHSPTIPDVDLSTASFTNQAEKMNLTRLLHEYSDVFSQHDFDYGCASGVEHEIPLFDDDPFRLPYRRIPPAQFQEVRRHIQKMEKAGVIKKSCSPYAPQSSWCRRRTGQSDFASMTDGLISRLDGTPSPYQGSTRRWMP